MAINISNTQKILEDLVNQVHEIEGAAMVTPDGLPLATTLPSHMDEERVSAMSATILSLGERIGSELGRGNIGRISVEGDAGYCMLTHCGKDAVLLVLADQNAKQGLLQLAVKQAVAELLITMN